MAPMPNGSNPSQRAKRAKRMSQNGAHRKGIQSLRGEVARLTTEQELEFAHLLLPDKPEQTEHPLRRQRRNDPVEGHVQDDDPELDAAPPPELHRPMQGVKFARMTGPGKSGFRPEHLSAMLRSKKRRAVNRLSKAISEAEVMAFNGTLPPAGWSWIMDSRLVYIAKKASAVPRPIRVGEIWRRLISKHLLYRYETKVRKVMVAASQFGVSMPGGAEALIHTRETIEAAMRADPDNGVWACIDVDFKNAFPSLLHESIDAAVGARVPELQPWSSWCQRNCGVIYLPSGAKYRAERGAEQGDPLASMQCGCVIADVVALALADMRAHKPPGTDLSCFGFWFADDGQYFCRPDDVDLFLKCLDKAAAAAGLSRGSGDDVKSTVRLVGTDAAVSSFLETQEENWITAHIRDTCKVLEPNSSIEVLGTVLGSQQDRDNAFAARLTKLQTLREDLADIECAGVELLLGRLCANTTKVAHLLRAHGCHLSKQLLDRFDDLAASFVGRVLGGDLHEKAIDQAALGMNFGGLGFRKAELLAAPAHLASLVEARPCVAHLISLASESGIHLPSAQHIFEAAVSRAQEDCISRLDDEKGRIIGLVCGDATLKAQDRFIKILSGTEQQPHHSQPDGSRSDDPVLTAPEHADPEIIRSIKPIKLQHDLSVLFDQDGLGNLMSHFETQPGGEADLARLQDLKDDTVSSKWLWTVDPRSRLTLESESFIAATRLRLGASFTCQPIRCRICNRSLDTNGSHALCCAPGEGTRGHNKIRDELFAVTRMADTTAEREVLGLLDTAPGLRPADILTNAVVPALSSALDIGVAAPHAVHAGDDCCEAMRLRKIRHYQDHLEDLRLQGIIYTPLIWSCWGREHEDTTKVLRQIARVAARRRGDKYEAVLSSLRDVIGAVLARRAAAMLLSCMPHYDHR